jgi:hypothetical protein
MLLISKLASWRGILFLLAILIFCLFGFKWRSRQLKLDADHKLLDSRFWYSPNEVRDFFDFLGEKLNLYALTQVTLDFIFPITYGFIFAILTTLLYSEGVSQKIIVVPLLATIFDLGENFILAYLAFNHVGKTSLLASAAVSSVFLIVGGVIYRYVLRL